MKDYLSAARKYRSDTSDCTKYSEAMERIGESILKCFGLPFAYTYYEELESIMLTDELTVELFESVIAKLSEHATKFKNPDFPSHAWLLENARKELFPDDEVIHLLGIYETLYHHFVYECYLMRTGIPVSEILVEMRKASEHRKLIDSLYDWRTPPMLVTETILALKEYGMRFIDGYDDYMRAFHIDRKMEAEIENNYIEDSTFHYPYGIDLSDTYWEKIYFWSRGHFALVCLYTRINDVWRKMYVGMNYKQFIAATMQSRSYSRAASIRQKGKRTFDAKYTLRYTAELLRTEVHSYFSTQVLMTCLLEKTDYMNEVNFYKWIS
ncbi:MAG: hypothetical protein JNM41_10600 [Flavipsychrobacter sp.]|nr:hypothetical protein [Flavipsychrobacter sp.]